MEDAGTAYAGVRRPMVPKLGKRGGEGRSPIIRTVLDEDTVRRLDAWRRTQPDPMPTRSAAVRFMVEQFLNDIKPPRGRGSK